VIAYSENPADFPIGSFLFANLVPHNATKPYTTRYLQAEKNLNYK